VCERNRSKAVLEIKRLPNVHVLAQQFISTQCSQVDQLVSLCFACVNVSDYVSPQHVAADLSTHVFLFRLLQWLSYLNARSLIAPSFPFSPLLSSSSMFLASLTSQFQKVALHRLLVQCKTFRVQLSAIFMLASMGFRNFRISSLSFASFLDCCSFPRMSTSEFTGSQGQRRQEAVGKQH
jgi:hypothetical protein